LRHRIKCHRIFPLWCQSTVWISLYAAKLPASIACRTRPRYILVRRSNMKGVADDTHFLVVAEWLGSFDHWSRCRAGSATGESQRPRGYDRRLEITSALGLGRGETNQPLSRQAVSAGTGE